MDVVTVVDVDAVVDAVMDEVVDEVVDERGSTAMTVVSNHKLHTNLRCGSHHVNLHHVTL